MREFNFGQPYEMLGVGDTLFWVQNGRRYLPKRKGPPQLVKEFWATRTPGGGQVFICKYCGQEFECAVFLGKHRRKSVCGLLREAERQRLKHLSEGERVLKRVLGTENDVRDRQVKEETG